MNTSFGGSTIEDDAEVELTVDVGGLFDEQPLDLLALRAGLVGDELHSQDLLGKLLSLVDGSRHLHAATLAAPSGVDLGLDDHAFGSVGEEFLGHIQRFIERVGHFAPRHGNAVFREDVLCLIFVNFHKRNDQCSSLTSCQFSVTSRQFCVHSAGASNRQLETDHWGL